MEYTASGIFGNGTDTPSSRSRNVPKMTPGRAALVCLMGRYLRGLLDPFVTLLEVHKLLYFMQAAGEPLKLKFAEGPYGPYAENLRHVLNAVEGHLIAGYADGGDAPDKQLELVPGALDDALAFLADRPDTQARFDRVSDLVEGFESSFGLELLATVHWIVGRGAGPNRCRRGGEDLGLEREEKNSFPAANSGSRSRRWRKRTG